MREDRRPPLWFMVGFIGLAVVVPYALGLWLLVFANQPLIVKISGAVAIGAAGTWNLWRFYRRWYRRDQREGPVAPD